MSVTNAGNGSSERECNTELKQACPLCLWNDFQMLTVVYEVSYNMFNVQGWLGGDGPHTNNYMLNVRVLYYT